MKGRRPRAMNPAFAAAHGIQSNKSGSNNDDKGSGGNMSLEFVLKRAQDTGKLVASNCTDLKVPLQDEVFHFPFGMSRYTEDLLTLVDFSDNQNQLGNSDLDARILKFRSVRSLRFRNCGLRLPPKLSFSSLEHLTILDLSGNKLARFDVGFLLWSNDKVSQLVELNLSNNQLQEIVATTSSAEAANISLPRLHTLNVSHNPPLERLLEESNGEAPVSCENLRILRCHHNPSLSSVATKSCLFSFLDSSKSTLEVLEVSHNPKLGSAAIDLSDYEQLHTVSFALDKLEKVPRISQSVKTLDLRSNKLKCVEGMFSHSSSSQLVDLMLADNYLTELDPLVIESMTNLKRLDLTSNKIRALPYQLGFLTELSTLNISGNPVLTRISSVAANSTNNPKPLLETLRKRAPTQTNGSHVSSSSGTKKANSQVASYLLTEALSTKGNSTLDLSGKLGDFGGETALEGLVQELKSKTTIDRGITSQLLLDSNRLESLPEELLSMCLPNVQTISLTDNLLAQLPGSLQSSSSKHVKQLRLGKNRLSTESLAQAFWFQPVASSPPSLSWSLQSLTKLDLSSNKLTSFPINTCSSVNCFPALEFLNLFNNKITSLENWKRLPESLVALNLSENNIEDIEPLSVLLGGGCPLLQKLSLLHNNVRRIPASLGLLSEYAQIASLNLQGNPQRGIPSHVLEKPCGDLLTYLSNRLTPDQRMATIERIEHHKQQKQQEAVASKTKSIDPPSSSHTLSYTKSQQETVSTSSVTEKTSRESPSGNSISQPSNDGPKIEEMSNSEEEKDTHKVLKELQQSVEKLKTEVDNLSLTQAKKYAVKKALAMERSKLIREERRLGLRK